MRLPCVSTGDAFFPLVILNVILLGDQAPYHSAGSKQGDSLVLGPLKWGASLPLPLLDFIFLPSETLLPSLGALHHTLQGLSISHP